MKRARLHAPLCLTQEHRVFSVAGPFPTIRQALKQRGWLEKMGTSATFHQQQQPARRKRNSKAGDDETTEESPDPLLVARLLRNCTPDLLWALRSETVDWRGLARWQLVNRFPKALFTTKVGITVGDVGLSCALQHMQWFTEEGVSETLFPRCYCVNQQDELVGFINDFRLTACYSMLRHVIISLQPPTVTTAEIKTEDKIVIPPKAIVFALSRAGEHVRHLKHEDVDDWSCAGGPSLGPGAQYGQGPGGPGEGGRVWDCEWDQFLTYYYQLVHEGAIIRWEGQDQKEAPRRASEAVMQYAQLRPYQNHDGTLNLWIVKPGARSCGRGIQRPLLIYNTKFDIRQWFLITCAQPLTIWMYRESYLRFCSQIFDMTNLHESVHLSNNAVQCRYQNCRRDPALPDENMWDCYTFQTYLRFDWLDSQRNCFELYGADFLLSEGDFRPWLLEVNCSPCMAPSTMVVDRRDDREASTGMFELVYRQNSPPAPPYQGVALGVKGRRLTASRPKRRHRHRKVGVRVRHGGSTTCSSGCSDCSSDDEARVDLAAQTRVTLAELRARLERLLAEDNRESKCVDMPENVSVCPGSRSAQTAPTSPPQPDTTKNIKEENVNEADEKCAEKTPEEEKPEHDLMLQPDNQRQSSREVAVIDDIDQEACFQDPGRSLAMVKEWRRRLEATRASCEQMLAQLKAFRDPPTMSTRQALMLRPPVEFPTQPSTCHADSCLALGSKLRKLASKDHKILVTTIESPA
ncbi:hypothetical protein B566_EDAN011005 [Ephemera danica]|nr:hypothetical protein B566_EDAN011005 [Ephemera danica]